jgi:hypothetical protein
MGTTMSVPTLAIPDSGKSQGSTAAEFQFTTSYALSFVTFFLLSPRYVVTHDVTASAMCIRHDAKLPDSLQLVKRLILCIQYL